MNKTTKQNLSGKVAVVTGASSGIGEATARALSQLGATVVLVARTQATLDSVAESIRAGGGKAVAISADVGAPGAADSLLATIQAELGGFDVLVNNAGVNHRGAVEDVAPSDLASIVNVNLLAPILLTRAALPLLRRRGGGAIVNVASLAGRVPLPHEATYSASKFGLRAFSFALADELEGSGSGINVSVVSPGPVQTGFILTEIDEVPDLVFSQPMSTAEEIAALVVQAIFDGAREKTPSSSSRIMTTTGYLLPKLRRRMTPLLELRGRAAKAKFRTAARKAGGG